MGGFSALFARLDPDPRVRGRQFEHVCKWFLTNDPLYKQRLRHVWLWKEWPDRPSDTEAGIDLVAEDADGHLWAVQAKAYGETKRIPKAELNKFLSESNTKQFSQRLLISTTIGGLHQLAHRAVDAQDKPVTVVDLTDLRATDAYLDWPDSLQNLRPSRPPKPATPHDYQRDAIKNVVTGFQSANRGQLIMACGTGKTLTSLFIKEKLAAERTLILLPSLSLLKQTLRVWMANRRNDFDILPVCSDATVSRDEDAVVAHTSELGVPVTTDPQDIARFLRRRGSRTVFATYQSSPQIAKAFALGHVPEFDLVIADEAHRCAGPVSSDFAKVLDPAEIKAKRRLFMTATPRYFTGRVLKASHDADYEIASMDDEARFGIAFHKLTFGEAIRLGRLTDYQVLIVGVDDATYREWAQAGVLVTRDGVEVTDAATLAGQIGLARAMQKYRLRRTISFHSRVKRAQEFACSMPEVIAWMPGRQRPQGNLWSAHASGAMNAGERGRLIKRLSQLGDDEFGLLANARCLTEGVDVPTLDGVAFIDPRRSEVDIVQAVGRAIRKSEDKNVGTIVIPVFINTDTDPEVALDSSVFKPVWDVIQALRAHDAELGEQLDALRRELGRKGGRPRLPDKIHVDIPARVGIDFARAFDVRLVEQTTQPWEFWFGLLERYVAERDTALVRGKEIFEGHRLGQWVIVQRTKWETLSEDRRQRLSNLPGWTTDVHATQWQKWFSRLQDYVAEHGTASVRDDYIDQDGNRLGKWVGKQRSKWDKLTDHQRDRLSRLPGWILDVREAWWEEGFAHLQRYAAQHGSVTVLKEAVVNGYRLGQWAAHQRMSWDSLSKEKQGRLQSLPGWTTNTLDYKWDLAFQYLQQFVSENGHARVPQNYFTHDGYGLGKWVSVQRRIFNTLSEERRQRLSRVPGWTLDARGDWWAEGFGYLQQYVAEHGTALIRQNITYNGYPLGQWVSNQKTRWKTLGSERQHRLSALPGWTMDARAARWEEGFRHLEEYTEEHGTTRLPSSKYVHHGFKLGIWVNTQRQSWATLADNRKQRLRDLPDWTENTRKALWEEGFGYLLQHVKENGTAMVTSNAVFDGFRLGQWVTVQRRNFENLDPELQGRFSELPGWSISARDAWWEEGFQHLEQYVGTHCNASPSQSYVDDRGYKLGTWVAKQRQNEAAGELAPERRERLEKLPGWQWTPRDSRWDEGFHRLLRYIEQNDGAYPAQAYESEDGYRLGAWANQQRQRYRKNDLGPEFSERLAGLPGWQWNPRDALWEEGFSRLRKYGRRNGHHSPPQTSADEDGYRLGSWVSQQRQQYRKRTLNDERVQRLSKLEGWEWNPPRGGAARR